MTGVGMAVVPWMTFFGKWKKVFSVKNDRVGITNLVIPDSVIAPVVS